jgi:hypothetical protein
MSEPFPDFKLNIYALCGALFLLLRCRSQSKRAQAIKKKGTGRLGRRLFPFKSDVSGGTESE